MSNEAAFLQAIQQHPDDASRRLVFADWLEERGDPRGEVLRLLSLLTQAIEVPDRTKLEERLRSLVASGVKPVGPFYTNSIGMKFALIWPGTFLMGSPESEKERRDKETQHEVVLTRAFWLSIHLVTQAQWREVMGNNPSDRQGDNHPVENVSWGDCLDFLNRLSGKEAVPYRFPTEAEWEYSCRAGTTTPFFFGETISVKQANYNGNWPYGNGKKGVNRKTTTPVDQFPANAWGVRDMHGNVAAWCSDWYGLYPKRRVVDPQGKTIRRVIAWPRSKASHRVIRGGNFDYSAAEGRSARRGMTIPTEVSSHIGFRAAISVT